MSPCIHIGNLTVCRPKAMKTVRRFFRCSSRRAKCPTVRRRLHECKFFEWYGWSCTCLTCGNTWQTE